MKAGSMKWQATFDMLFCVEEAYDPHEGIVVIPNTVMAGKEKIAKVVSVGPNVRSYKEGDYVAYEKAARCQGGIFVRVRDILGRLVPKDAPNSAQAVMPDGTPITEVDGEKLAHDMAAAD
jgi:hypothetical protein